MSHLTKKQQKSENNVADMMCHSKFFMEENGHAVIEEIRDVNVPLTEDRFWMLFPSSFRTFERLKHLKRNTGELSL